MRLSRLLAAAVVAIALLGACGGGDNSDSASTTDTTDTTAASTATTAASSGGAKVSVKGLAFNPASVSIKKGEKVTWTFEDGAIPHNVTFADFKSETMDKGTFEHTFDTTGTFDYACTVHPAMKGSVAVS